jgi:predicted GNAT superfamily acetyltransferase
MSAAIRELRSSDLDRLLEINQANTPEVGSVDCERLAFIFDEATIRRGVTVDDGLVGFTLVLGPSSAYDSVNYRWFQTNHPGSWYLDRVAISTGYRRRGLGTGLYENVFDALGAARAGALGLEVNLEPPNPASMAFHERLGFEYLAQETTDYGAVAMLLRTIQAGIASSS